MKTKLFTLIMLLAVSVTAFAQKKVAVYVTGQESSINKVLGDQLVSAFAKSGKYIAIERTASFLAELGKEQSYQRTGAVSDNEISRLGKQFGVQLVCVVDVSDVFGQKYVSARLIDVERAEVINTANAQSSLNNMDELMRVSNILKGQLFSEMAEKSKVPQGYVDLGLSSGTYWKKSNSGRNTYSQAVLTGKNINADIPTLQQWQELIDECTWTWKQNGYEVKGNNGNSIFLRVNELEGACYWTSTFAGQDRLYADPKHKNQKYYDNYFCLFFGRSGGNLSFMKIWDSHEQGVYFVINPKE